jgi:hypothetical protein
MPEEMGEDWAKPLRGRHGGLEEAESWRVKERGSMQETRAYTSACEMGISTTASIIVMKRMTIYTTVVKVLHRM